MSENSIRIPLIIATVLRGINLLITIGCVQAEDAIYQIYAAGLTGQKVMPTTEIMSQLLILAVYVIFCLVVYMYKGDSRRLIAGVFIVCMCLFAIAQTGLSRVSTMAAARVAGAEYLAAYSAVTSAISMITSPGALVATALFFISSGRYGVSVRNTETDFYS